MTDSVALYGLFDSHTNKCRYVGQTIDPKQREKAHNHFQTGKGRGLAFVVLAWVEPCDADMLETKLIAKFRSKSEADLNKHARGHSNGTNKNNSCIIVWVETGQEFLGMNEAARYFGCSPQTIANSIRLYGGRFRRSCTLKRLPDPRK